jgi:hypothetical protein
MTRQGCTPGNAANAGRTRNATADPVRPAILAARHASIRGAAGAPNATYAEFMPDARILNVRKLMDRQLVADKRHLLLPQTSGLSFGLDPEAVARYGVRVGNNDDAWQVHGYKRRP